jgi:RNA polymerase sigma-70 factor (ECF subfamily)
MFTFAEDMALIKKQAKTKEDTAAILQRIKRGDEFFLSNLYETHRKDFLTLGLKYLNDESKILDVYQDAFITFYENVRADKVNASKSTVKTYIFSIGKQQLTHQFKTETKQISAQELEDFEFVDVVIEQQVNLNEIQISLQTAITQLDKTARKRLVLFNYRQYETEFIVEAMSAKNAGILQNQLTKDINTLKKKLSNQTHLPNKLQFRKDLQSALANESQQLMKDKFIQLDQKIVARQSMNKFFILIGVLLFIFVGSLVIWNNIKVN